MSLGTILSKVAPTLEAALPLVGGPFGGVASMAIKAVSDIVSPGEPNPTVQTVTAALAGATPDQLLALKKADQEFDLKTKELGIDVLKLKVELEEKEDDDDTADRASARASFGLVKFIPQMVMSAFFILAYTLLEYAVMIGAVHVPDAYMATFNRITDTLLTLLVLICNFWFGSTHGSQKKDEALASAATS